MITRQNQVRIILSNINNDVIDDKLVAKLANIAEALDIKSNDALFPLMVALEYYKVIYETIPNKINDIVQSNISENKNILKSEIDKIANEYKKDIVHSTNRLFEQKLPITIKDCIDKEIKIYTETILKPAILELKNASDSYNHSITNLSNQQIKKYTYFAIFSFVGIIIGKFIL